MTTLPSSVVCNVPAPYSAGWNFQQCFYAILYLNHPLTSVQNFTEIVLGEPLHRGLNARGVAKYGDFGPVEGYISEAVQDTASGTINQWYEIVPIESNGTILDRLGWPLIRVLGPQFGENVYISEVRGASKVKSDAQVNYEQELRPRAEIFCCNEWPYWSLATTWSRLENESPVVHCLRIVGAFIRFGDMDLDREWMSPTAIFPYYAMTTSHLCRQMDRFHYEWVGEVHHWSRWHTAPDTMPFRSLGTSIHLDILHSTVLGSSERVALPCSDGILPDQPGCIHRAYHTQRDFIKLFKYVQTAQDMTEWRVISTASGLCVWW